MSIITGIPDTATTTWLAISAGSNNQRAWAFIVTEPMFLHTVAARMRKSGSNNATVQFAVWANDGLGRPGERLGYTGNITVSAGSGSAGDIASGALTSSKADPLTGHAGSAIRVQPNTTYFWGPEVQGSGADIGVIAPAATNYRRTVGGGNPTDPFGAFTTETPASASTPILWGVAEQDQPITTTLTGPASTVSTVTPIITGTVSQSDSIAPMWDGLAQYQLEVRDVATTTQVWFATFPATSAERLANAFSQVYAGTALVSGSQYEVRARAAGDLGVYGAWTAWRAFTVGSVGVVVTSASTPTGKQTSGIITPFTAQWTHPLATAMATVDFRILVNGVPAQTSETLHPTGITKSAANNATFSVSNTEAGIATATKPLPPGSYAYQFRGHAVGGGIGPWSDAVAFSVNSPPNQPSNLRPTSGQTLSSRPRSLWDGSDADLDDVFGGDVVSYLEITWPDSSVHTYGPGTTPPTLYDPVSGSGYLDHTATSMPNNSGTYTWRVRLHDGDAYGPFSAPNLLTLVVAPALTITAPTENATVTSSTPGITFSILADTMASYNVRFYRPGVLAAFFDSGSIPLSPAVSSTTYQPPAGLLENGQLYDVQVDAFTPINVRSTSDKRRFRVTYTAATGLTAVDATLLTNERDWEPTSVVIVWGQTNLPQDQFAGYVVWRRRNTDATADAVAIRVLPNAGQTTFIDHHPPPNASLIYSVTQLKRASNGDIQSSVPVEVQVDTVLTVPVLVSLTSGATLRAPIAWLNSGLGLGFKRADATVETWGSLGAPLWVRNPANYGAERFPLKFTIRSDSHGTLHEHLRTWRAIVRSGDAYSFRIEIDRIFVKVNASSDWAHKTDIPGVWDISITLEEIYEREAVDVAV